MTIERIKSICSVRKQLEPNITLLLKVIPSDKEILDIIVMTVINTSWREQERQLQWLKICTTNDWLIHGSSLPKS